MPLAETAATLPDFEEDDDASSDLLEANFAETSARRAHARTPRPCWLVAPAKLVGYVCRWIEAARRSVVTTVNIEPTMLYWRVGARIRTEVLRDARAAYGELVIAALAQKLQPGYGRWFSEKTR